MTATIKIEDPKKEKVDRFLASLLLQEGVKITVQEAVGLMVDYALENEEVLIKKLRKLPPQTRGLIPWQRHEGVASPARDCDSKGTFFGPNC